MRVKGVAGALLSALLMGGAVAPVLARSSQPANEPVTPRMPPSSAYQSPSLARDPSQGRDLALAYHDGSNLETCYLALSSDGGRSWRRVALVGKDAVHPFPESFMQCLNPAVAFGSGGTLYYVYYVRQSGGNLGDAVGIISSDDGSKTFSTPRLVDQTDGPQAWARDLCEQDPCDYQAGIAVDRRSDRIYVTWTRGCYVCGPGGIFVAASGDGGVTFDPPVHLSSPLPTRDSALLSSVTVGRDGAVHVAWLDWSNYYTAAFSVPLVLNVSTSTDGGETFSSSTVGEIQPTCPQLYCNYLWWFPSDSLTQVAADRKGRVYVATWHKLGPLQDRVAPRPGDNYRIFFSSSPDGGTTWTPLEPVGVPEGAEDHDQHRPQLTIGAGGRIDLVYYDISPDSQQHVYRIHSTDGGITFSTPVRITNVPHDARIGPPGFDSDRAAALGSNLASASSGKRLFAVWTDSRRGTPDDGHQDLYFAKMRVP
ncbi:MAG: sialidase family protein [Actinomycetota bacterium]